MQPFIVLDITFIVLTFKKFIHHQKSMVVDVLDTMQWHWIDLG